MTLRLNGGVDLDRLMNSRPIGYHIDSINTDVYVYFDPSIRRNHPSIRTSNYSVDIALPRKDRKYLLGLDGKMLAVGSGRFIGHHIKLHVNHAKDNKRD